MLRPIAFLFLSMTALSVEAHAEEGLWKGLRTSDHFYGCKITSDGSVYVSAHYGAEIMGKERGLDLQEATYNAIISATDDLSERAQKNGANGIIDVRIELVQTADAVYESGTNWSRDGKSFDRDGTYFALAYGTPVTLDCD